MTSMPAGVPMIAGIENMPTPNQIARSRPAPRLGATAGSVILRRVRNMPAPLSREASSRAGSRFRNPAEAFMNTNGTA
jgi:hypothetical protein